MEPYLYRALVFLVEFLFGAYILLFMLRFILELSRAHFYNAPAMALQAITDPPIRLLRRLLPRRRHFDPCIPLILLILQITQLALLLGLAGAAMTPVGLALLALTELLELAIYVYLFSIMLMVILSWVAPYSGHSPLGALLSAINAPLLGRLQRILPPVHSLDFTPLAAILLLLLARIVIHAPLHDLAVQLMRVA